MTIEQYFKTFSKKIDAENFIDEIFSNLFHDLNEGFMIN
jgi:hypothetical protein